jgi:pseudouridine synthase
MLWVLHKPANVDTDLAPGSDLRRLSDIAIPVRKYHHIGRLDRDTSGVLLLCTDGQLTHRLMNSSVLVKTYLARVAKPPTTEQLSQLVAGVLLGDGPAFADSACEVPEFHEAVSPLFLVPNYQEVLPTNFFVRIETREGRNRIVRRMLAHVGLPVLGLHREQVGSVSLSPASIPGTIDELASPDLEKLLLEV